MPPIGYLNDPVTRTIVRDPDRFPPVREIFRLMLTGAYSPRGLRDKATREWGLLTVKRRRIGGNPLSRSAIYRLLTNPFYAGVIRWQGKTYPGRHEPMITLEEFDCIQSLLGREGRPRPKVRAFAFTGVIRCGECAHAVTAEEKVNRFGSRYTYYHCTHQSEKAACRQPSVEVRDLERQILSDLESLRMPDEIHRWFLQMLRNEKESGRSETEERKRGLEAAVAANARKLTNLTSLRLRDLLSDEEFVAERESLRKEGLSLRQSLSRAEQGETPFEPLEKLASFSNRAASLFREGDPETKRLILEIVCSNPTLKDRKLNIDAKDPLLRLPKTRSNPNLWAAVDDVRTLLDEPEFLKMIGAISVLFGRVAEVRAAA